MDAECSHGGVQLFRDELKAITAKVPDLIQIGGSFVKLSLLDVSDNFIVVGSKENGLFVYNRSLHAMLPLVNNECSSQLECLRIIDSPDECSIIATGNSEGGLAVLQINSISNKIKKLSDSSAHKGDTVRRVAVATNKLVSVDETGIVMVSLFDFTLSTFEHLFLYSGGTNILLQYTYLPCILDVQRDSFVIFDEDRESKEYSLGIGSDAGGIYSFHYVNTESSLFIHCQRSILRTKLSNTDMSLVCKTLVEFASEIRLCDFSDSKGAFAMDTELRIYDLEKFVPIWTVSITKPLSCMSIDIDGSVLTLCPPRLLVRYGITPPDGELVIPSAHGKADQSTLFASLYASPKKGTRTLLSSVVAKAKDFTEKADVPALLSSGMKRVDSASTALLDSVQEYVDTSNGISAVMGTPVVPPTSSRMAANFVHDNVEVAEELASMHTVDVFRKKKSKKSVRDMDNDSYESEDRTIIRKADTQLESEPESTVTQDGIAELRRQVLCGVLGISGSTTNSNSHISSNSSLYGTPPQELHDSADDVFDSSHETMPPTRDVEEKVEDDFDIKNLTDDVNSTNVSSSQDPPLEVNVSVQEDSISPVLSPNRAYEDIMFSLVMKNQENQAPVSRENSVTQTISDRTEVIRKHMNRRAAAVNDHLDLWNEIAAPFTIKSMLITEHTIVLLHRKKKPRLAPIAQLGQKALNWKSVKWDARTLVAAADESLIVRESQGKLTLFTGSLAPSATFGEVIQDNTAAMNVALRERDLWYNTDSYMDGVFLLMELPEAIFCRVECEMPLTNLTASSVAMWAINALTGGLVVRVGLNKCRMGTYWVEVSPIGPRQLVSLSLCETTGFALDVDGVLWMATGVDHHHPYGLHDYWLAVAHPVTLAKSKTAIIDWKVYASVSGLYLSAGKTLYYCKSAVSGHQFISVVANRHSLLDNFSLLSAGMFDGSTEYDGVAACRPNSDVFLYRVRRSQFITTPLPESSTAITCIVGLNSEQALVDGCGQVWRRTQNGPWTRDTELEAVISSIALSENTEWVVTTQGQVLFRKLSGTWAIVASPDESHCTSIVCSRSGQYVWLSNGRRAWARTGIVIGRTESGASWVQSDHSGELSSIAVGDRVVWALDSAGALLQLKGVAATNPAGNYWKFVNNTGLRAISVDGQGGLWAISNENRIIRHSVGIFPPQPRIRGSSTCHDDYNMV